MGKKKKSKGAFVLLVILVLLGGGAYYLYQKYFAGEIHLKDKNYTFLFIGRDDNFEDVISSLQDQGLTEDPGSFEWLARRMDLDKNIHPGKYRITNGMNMRQIVNLIKYGKEEKVKLTYNSQIHDLDELVEYSDEKLELSSAELEDYLADEAKLRTDFGLDPDNAFALVTPGVYEVSWAIAPEDLIGEFKTRFNNFWNSGRLAQARKSGYTVAEIITLASIVQSESHIGSEQEKIAGVYVNRLRKGMRLEADPTLRFANKNFDAQRFYNSDKETSSPYNTYRYKGLPPGPICLVQPRAIESTLNYTRHNYIFFCAKPELNGYSDFSATYDQHCRYANAYQKAMSRRGITR